MRILSETVMTFAMILATSCTRTRDTDQKSAQVQPSAIPAPVAAKPRDFVQTVSIATFHKDQLDECLDITSRQYPPDGAPPDWTPKLAEIDAGKGQLKLGKPCAEQFADRLVLATCTIQKDGSKTVGNAVHAELIDRYYNIDTLDTDDSYMRDCIEMHGDWKALSRESLEYKQARMHSHARMLQKSIEQQ